MYVAWLTRAVSALVVGTMKPNISVPVTDSSTASPMGKALPK